MEIQLTNIQLSNGSDSNVALKNLSRTRNIKEVKLHIF